MTRLNQEQTDMIDHQITRILRPIIFRIIVAYTILLIAGVLGLMFAAWQIRENSQRDVARNTQTTRALCTFRHDLQRRVDNSITFLKDHPDGIPGIPRAVFLAGIRSQQSTVDSLSDLRCRE